MKIALVHDYIKEYGGAERVLEALHNRYPDAPIYTLVYAPQFLGPHENRFRDWDIRPSFLQQIPYCYKLISVFRLIAPLVFRMFNFSEYDVILVSSTGAYSPNILDKKQAKLLCYCHTPPRYLYGYATAREASHNPFIKVGVAIMTHILRLVDFKAAQHVDQFIANSENIKKRIEKFYRRDAVVVYPPVEIPTSFLRKQESWIPDQVRDDNRKVGNEDTNYFLCGGRIARPKHIDLIVKACSELGVSLKVFGKSFAGYGDEILRNTQDNKNIEFLGEVSDAEKLRLMQGAKAFIFAAEDDDFGIVPVEAMGVGTPVIAYRSGGVQETVIDKKTGLFFDELTIESLIEAIKKFEKIHFDPKVCQKQAEKFGRKNFEEKMRDIVGA